ncbi:MAG TPA: hypothetical protein VMU86_06365, partial [Steroidobacteraceae bacterium]|nr:hypothetical protein [Steroidobacteraceae bacterium]
LPPPAPPPPRSLWPWIAVAAAAAIGALSFALLWAGARDRLAASRAEVATLAASERRLDLARADLDHTVQGLTAALATAASGGAAGAAGGAPALGASAAGAATARTATVPYGEVPLGRGRRDALRELLSQLETEGFHGVVKVTSYPGLFCLSGDATDGYVPAKPSLPAAECGAIGNPFEESLSGQQRQSLAFGNLIAGVRERSGGAISVTIQDGSSSQVAVPYPARVPTLTAGEWNKAAAANNRVEFTVEPGAAP